MYICIQSIHNFTLTLIPFPFFSLYHLPFPFNMNFSLKVHHHLARLHWLVHMKWLTDFFFSFPLFVVQIYFVGCAAFFGGDSSALSSWWREEIVALFLQISLNKSLTLRIKFTVRIFCLQLLFLLALLISNCCFNYSALFNFVCIFICSFSSCPGLQVTNKQLVSYTDLSKICFQEINSYTFFPFPNYL